MIGSMGEDMLCLEVLGSIMFEVGPLLGLGLQGISMLVYIMISGVLKFCPRLE